MKPSALVVQPPIVLDRDFIDYPPLMPYYTAATAAMLLIAGLGSGLSVAGSSGEAAGSKKSQKVVPKKFKGTWKGTWNNLTFGSNGKASITLRLKGSKRKPVMFGVFRLGGNAFGCDSIAPRPVRMKKGSGRNRWNSRGFNAAWDNGQGPVRIRYNHRRGKLSGSGVSPCTSTITYRFNGTMNSRSAKANVSIFLNGEPFAKSKLKMKR